MLFNPWFLIIFPVKIAAIWMDTADLSDWHDEEDQRGLQQPGDVTNVLLIPSD